MFLDGISKSIHNLYDSIPGKTHPLKLTFIAHIASTATVGYMLRDRLPPGFIKSVVLSALPIIGGLAQIGRPPTPFTRVAISLGIGVQINESIFSTKLCRDASSLRGQFLFFCFAYNEAYYAIRGFNSLFPKQRSQPRMNEVKTPTIYSRALDLLFQSPFLAIRTYYKPGATLKGLALGSIFGNAYLYRRISKELNLDERQIKSSFVRFKGIINFFIPPPVSSASRVAKIWNEWNQMVLSVVFSPTAFYYSFKQGKEMVSFFESLQKRQHPSSSSREQ